MKLWKGKAYAFKRTGDTYCEVDSMDVEYFCADRRYAEDRIYKSIDRGYPDVVYTIDITAEEDSDGDTTSN